MDKGSGAEYQGKSLAEIDINPETEFAEVDDEEIDEPEAINTHNSRGISTYEEQIHENESSRDGNYITLLVTKFSNFELKNYGYNNFVIRRYFKRKNSKAEKKI